MLFRRNNSHIMVCSKYIKSSIELWKIKLGLDKMSNNTLNSKWKKNHQMFRSTERNSSTAWHQLLRKKLTGLSSLAETGHTAQPHQIGGLACDPVIFYCTIKELCNLRKVVHRWNSDRTKILVSLCVKHGTRDWNRSVRVWLAPIDGHNAEYTNDHWW